MNKLLSVFLVVLCSTLLSACKKDEPTQATASDQPEIVGCNSVKYKGVTFGNLGCAQGIAGFDVDITQNGVSASFHITCSSGCISAVTVKPPSPPPPSLGVTPSSISVQVGQNAQAQISGGTLPYAIQNSPNASIATAGIQGTSTLAVNGIGAGTTSVIVRDNSSPLQTITVPITVTGTGLNIAGTWSGTFTSSIVTTPTQIILVLSQSGSGVTGTYSTQGGGVGTVSGTLSGSIFTFGLVQTTTGCPGTFFGSGTVSGNSMTFTFSGSDCLGAHSNGQGTVTRGASTLTVIPSSITVQVGQNAQAQISSGTLPYVIQSPPNASIATASIQGTSTLGVNGIGAGITSVTVRDNSSPVQTRTVPITVSATTSDSLYVKISLLNLPSTLTFNQSHVPTNYAEYWWGILFNTDGNASTGNQGYDIEIALVHFKEAGNSFQASPIQGTLHQVIEWIDTLGSVRGYTRHSNVASRIDPANSNTLVMAVPRSWAEISRIDALDNFYIHTSYYAASPPSGYDETSVGVGTQPITDPSGDTNYGFVDIVLGGWNTQLLLMNNRRAWIPRTGRNNVTDNHQNENLRWSGGKWIHDSSR